jgi:ribosomal protein L28
MASKFERLYLDAIQRVKNYERVTDRAADMEILRNALRVIERNGLSQEFVNELSKPKPKE